MQTSPELLNKKTLPGLPGISLSSQKLPGTFPGFSLHVDFDKEQSTGSPEVPQTSLEVARTSPEVTGPPHLSTPLPGQFDTL